MKFKDYGKDCGEGVDDFALKEEDPLKDTETSGSSWLACCKLYHKPVLQTCLSG